MNEVLLIFFLNYMGHGQQDHAQTHHLTLHYCVGRSPEQNLLSVVLPEE